MVKTKTDFDLIVIGSGSAGGAGALLAAKSGLKVALIEARKWGGAGLNFEDAPYDALFNATHLLAKSIQGAKYGLTSTNLRYNYPTIMNYKNTVLHKVGANDKKVFDQAGITTIHGTAHFISPTEISVGSQQLSAKKFLIATGADMLDTGIKGLENVNYLTAETVLDLARPPKTIFIVGAGSTGCELAQYFSELGSKVLVAEVAGRLLPREDEEVGQAFDHIFNRLDIKVLTQSRVVAIEKDTISKKVIFIRGGQEKSVRIDKVVLCTGSTPSTDLGLENAGVQYGRTGIKVTPNMQTTSKNIFAAGDCIGGDSCTEKALRETATAISTIITGSKKSTVDYAGIARITRTYPAVASVGVTEDDCIRRDRKIRKAILPLSSVTASKTSGFRDGFIKLLTDRNQKIIGASLVAPSAATLIQELSLAIKLGLSASDLAETPHVASDWSEIIRLAALRLS